MTNSEEQWVTINETSQIMGRSENAVRQLVKRGKFDQLRKIRKNGRGYWVIHRDSISRLVNSGQWVMKTSGSNESDLTNKTNTDHTIPLQHYEEQRSQWLQERDQLQAGLMMYRYKFEEIEHRMKMLPAPVETVVSKMADMEEALSAEVKYREQLTSALHEKEVELTRLHAVQDQEQRRSWWKKLFGLR